MSLKSVASSDFSGRRRQRLSGTPLQSELGAWVTLPDYRTRAACPIMLSMYRPAPALLPTAVLTVIKATPGWLVRLDAELMYLLATLQRGRALSGGILEIGTYAGKSAIALAAALGPDETLFLCDPYVDTAPTSDTACEGRERLHPETPLANLARVFPLLHVEFLHYPSSELPSMGLSDANLRVVHVDGSHSYEDCRSDILWSRRHLDDSMGLLVVDDFRAAQTPGVAAAFWETYLAGYFQDCILTEHKAYLLFGSGWSGWISWLLPILRGRVGLQEERVGRRTLTRLWPLNQCSD